MLGEKRVGPSRAPAQSRELAGDGAAPWTDAVDQAMTRSYRLREVHGAAKRWLSNGVSTGEPARYRAGSYICHPCGQLSTAGQRIDG